MERLLAIEVFNHTDEPQLVEIRISQRATTDVPLMSIAVHPQQRDSRWRITRSAHGLIAQPSKPATRPGFFLWQAPPGAELLAHSKSDIYVVAPEGVRYRLKWA